jgi:hypothetical protein
VTAVSPAPANISEVLDKHWSMATALEQISGCDFQCEGGPLSNNAGWQWLVAAAKVGPQFWPGQGVWFQVDAEAAGVKLSQWVHFYIVGCAMSSDTEKRLWTYSLSYDPPAPYHYGKVHFTAVAADKLRLINPTLAESVS